MRSCASDLWCFSCGASYAVTKHRLRCGCGMPLEQRYQLKEADQEAVAPPSPAAGLGIWRFSNLLPSMDPQRRLSLGEGDTPLIRCQRFAEAQGIDLWVKDESRNPTGTFKARGAAVAISKLRSLGWHRLRIETIGNAGSAWSAYAARAGMDIVVTLPQHPPVPEVGLLEPPWYGAQVVVSDEATVPPDDASDEVCVNAFAEPYRIEGEKTILYEVVEQLGGDVPNHIVWPTGGGVGLVGLAKAYEELRELGRVPTHNAMSIVAAQHAGEAPLSLALRSGKALPPVSELGHGIAPGVWPSDRSPDAYIVNRVRSVTDSCGAAVGDSEIVAVMARMATTEGLLLGPEGAVAVAAVSALQQEGIIHRGDQVVCVNTSSALRYPHLLKRYGTTVGPRDQTPAH